jgi:hypothetical protein
MTTKTVSIRMEEGLYDKLVDFCAEIYIPVSALFSAFAAKTVHDRRVPFDIGGMAQSASNSLVGMGSASLDAQPLCGMFPELSSLEFIAAKKAEKALEL